MHPCPVCWIQCPCDSGESDADECQHCFDALTRRDKWLANMSDQERRGWMRARDIEVD